MPVDGCIRVAIIGEDEVHRALAMALLDAVMLDIFQKCSADWLMEIDEVRSWVVDASGKLFYDSHRDEPPPRKLRTAGHIRGEPLKPGASKLRHLYLLHTQQSPAPDLVIILQDTDGSPSLQAAANQVLQLWEPDFPVLVIGLPHRDADAWLFAAPAPDEVSSRLELARKVLSFDPFHEPERLTSSPNHAITDAKRVVQYVLLGEGEELRIGHPKSKPPSNADELAQRLTTDLPRLRRFVGCGLASFIDALSLAIGTIFREHLPMEPRP